MKAVILIVTLMFALAAGSQATTAFIALRSRRLTGSKRMRAWAIVLGTLLLTLLVLAVGLTALRL